MINAISNQSLAGVSAGTGSNQQGDDTVAGAFDAALIAARKAEERKQQHATELDAIKSKGFTAWVRDTQIEELKKKLRSQVMADMGLDEDQLTRLSAVMRQILEQKIQEEVEKRMQEEMAKDQANGTAEGAKTAAIQQPGKNDPQDGKSCPVIPALSWPGGASLF